MRASLIVAGVLAFVVIIPWSTSGSESLYPIAIGAAVFYFALSVISPGPAMVPGIFMFIGVISSAGSAQPSPLATFGAVMALPLAMLTDDD